MANYDQRKNDNKKSAPSKDGDKNSDRRENSKTQGHSEQKAKKDNERM